MKMIPNTNTHHRYTEASAVDENAGIIFLSVDSIRPNHAQPRNRFDTNTMIRLADSVRRYGILQPLTVRRLLPKQDSTECASLTPISPVYELIAGERRLRAAKLAGLTHVPCVLAQADEQLSAELAIIENLLREDLNMFEQARAFGRLIVNFSMTQEQIARKMSMSQSAVANKLRLLRLTKDEQQMILSGGLTERHARTMLRLPAGEMRSDAIRHVIDTRMNVSMTEAYVEKILNDGAAEESTSAVCSKHEPSQTATCKKKLVLTDLRLFYNSIENAVKILRQTGMSPEIDQSEENGRLVIRISVNAPAERCCNDVSRET